MPNTVLMNVCGEFSQIVCASGNAPSLPGNPENGTEAQIGGAPKKMI